MSTENNSSKKASGRFGKAARLTVRIFKWPVLIAIPLLIFVLSAWWSLINTLSSDIQVVPDIIGKAPEEARFLLSSRGLELITEETTQFSQAIDSGLILVQTPQTGTKIKRGRSVKAILSAGFKRVLMPNLLGKSLRESELIVRQKGLRLRQRDSIYSDSLPQGTIVAQDPAPSSALLTDNIDVIISRGPEPRQALLPDFYGKPLLTVLKFLRANGFHVVVRERGGGGDISNRDPFELRRFVIYRQSPAGGSLIYLTSPETIILRVERSRR